MSQLNINQCDDDTDYITWMPTDEVCICVNDSDSFWLAKHQLNKSGNDVKENIVLAAYKVEHFKPPLMLYTAM